MVLEPTYGDLDGDGNPIEDNDNTSWRDPDTLGEATAKIAKAFMKMCSYQASRRKNFADPKQRRSWNRIEKKLKDGTMPVAWIKFVYEFTKEKNTHKITRNFATTTEYILNREKMIEWISENVLSDEVEDHEEDPGAPVNYD